MTTPSARPPFVVLFGDRARAARSERILRRAGWAVENVCGLPSADVAHLLTNGAAWLFRAGCWTAALGTISIPAPSQTRRPLCALAAVRGWGETKPGDEAQRW